MLDLSMGSLKTSFSLLWADFLRKSSMIREFPSARLNVKKVGLSCLYVLVLALGLSVAPKL